MITQDQLENKSMTAAPDIETLRAHVTALRADETRQGQELHASQADLEASEAQIKQANYSLAKGGQARERLTVALIAQSSAQSRLVDVVEKLNVTRSQLRQATEALREAEARLAVQEAAALEQEIITELLRFSEQVLDFKAQCSRLESLRERAKQTGQLVTPAVLEALYPNWGELRAGYESRLEFIAKITPLPEGPAAIVRTAARDRALAVKAERARGERAEAERTRGRRIPSGDTFESKYVDGKVLNRRIDL